MAGEIELLTKRSLAGLVGYDAAGLVGRMDIAARSTRFVTAGDGLMNVNSAGNKFLNFRRRRVAKTRITNPRIIIPNFYMSGSNEVGTGSAATVNGASFEIKGVVTAVTFAGVATGSVPNLSFLVSDPLPNTVLEKGEVFFAKGYLNFPSGMAYRSDAAGSIQNALGGDCFEYSANALTDRTLTPGPFTSSDASNVFEPIIVGDSDDPALFWLGDSTFSGVGDTLAQYDDTNCAGFTKTLGQFFGGFNAGVGSATAAGFTAAVRTNRTLLANTYATHLIQGHTLNMLGNTLVSMQTDLTNERILFPNLRALMTTAPPNGATTDAGATVANQTPGANETKRVQLNDWKRLCPAVGIGANAAQAAWSGCLDIASLFEVNAAGVKTRNGGRYPAGMSADMLHPTSPGYQMARDGGALLRAALAA